MFSGHPRPTVLVVEDDPPLRNLYRSTLIGAGFAVVAVADGTEALRELEHRVPAAVVLDIALPRVSGRDVGQELKASITMRHIPIIVVTGTDPNGISDLRVECVLQKPVAPEELVATVRRWIRKRSAAAAF